MISTLLEAVRGARVFDLEQPRYFGAPTFPSHLPGFVYTLHRRHEAGLGPRTSASGTIVAAEHSGTHIDALCHQAEQLALYGNRPVTPAVQTPTGFTELGAETIAPILAHGVLLDVAATEGVDRLAPGHSIGADEFDRAAAAARVSPVPGDVLLVRTGNASVWDDPEEYLRGPGVGAGGAHWLAERRPLAVGADNVAFDVPDRVDPAIGATLPCHVVLIVRHGIYIVENLNLEELSAAGVSEFVFVCLPLKMRGVTGSPVRPLALAPGSPVPIGSADR